MKRVLLFSTLAILMIVFMGAGWIGLPSKQQYSLWVVDLVSETPVNPNVGQARIYGKSTDGKMYKLDSSGVETELGSGGGIENALGDRLLQSIGTSIVSESPIRLANGNDLEGIGSIDAAGSINASGSMTLVGGISVSDIAGQSVIVTQGIEAASASFTDFLQLSEISEGSVATPGSADQRFFVDSTDKVLKVKDENALVYDQGKQFDNAFVPYKNANAELVNAFTDEYSTGQSATWGDSGSIGGTPSITTTGAELVNGDRAYKLLTPSNNDWVKSSQIPLPQSMRGKTLALNFQHKTSITSGTIRVYIKPENLALASAINYELELNSTGSFGSFVFFAGASDTYVEIGIQTTSPGAGYITWNKPEIVPYETQTMKDSMDTQSVRYQNYAGDGSSSTKIPRFTNLISSTGSDLFDCDNSATLGMNCTILRAGQYCASFTFNTNTVSVVHGLSLNSTQLTTNFVSITASDRLAISRDGGGTQDNTSSWCGDLEVGDIVRPHTDGSAGGTANRVLFSFSGYARNDVAVANNVKDNCSIQLYGQNGYGSTASFIARFTTSDIQCDGGQISYADDSTNSTRLTVNEDGLYNFNWCYQRSGSGANFPGVSFDSTGSAITTSTAVFSQTQNLVMYNQTPSAASVVGCVSEQRELTAGTIVRPHNNGEAINSSFSSLTISKMGTEQKAGILLPPSCTFSHQLSSGTNGGTNSTGSYGTMTLNTVNSSSGSNCSFARLSSNVITSVTPGTYEYRFCQVGYLVNAFKARLRNSTDSTTLGLGNSSYSGSTGTALITSCGEGVFTLTATKNIILEARFQTSQANSGLGRATSFGDNELYNWVELTKIK